MSNRSDLHRVATGPERGPYVLVLHGITESRRYWLPGLLPLAARRRLIIPDLPGFGRSPKPFTDYTPGFFVDALLRLIEDEIPAGAPFSIVGHSLGALLALELAVREPARVERLSLVNLPRFNDADEAHQVWFAGSFSYRNLLQSNSLRANLAQVRRSGVRLTARSLRGLPWRVVSDARLFTYRSLTSTLENCLLHYRVDDILAAAPPIPTLVLHGEVDQVAPLARLIDLPFHSPYPEVHVIRRAGHHPFHTHGALCVRLLEAHLSGRTAASVADGKSSFSLPGPAGVARGTAGA